jgi:hypothetical protein
MSVFAWALVCRAAAPAKAAGYHGYYRQIDYPVPPAAPQAFGPSSVDLDAATDQAISTGGGDTRKTMKGLIVANDFLALRFDELRGGGIERPSSWWASAGPPVRGCPARKDLLFLLFVPPN